MPAGQGPVGGRCAAGVPLYLRLCVLLPAERGRAWLPAMIGIAIAWTMAFRAAVESWGGCWRSAGLVACRGDVRP